MRNFLRVFPWVSQRKPSRMSGRRILSTSARCESVGMTNGLRPPSTLCMRIIPSRNPGLLSSRAALQHGGRVDLDHEVRIEAWILVHSVLSVSARIAQHPSPVEDIVEAVVRMPVYPQARATTVDEPLRVRNETGV